MFQVGLDACYWLTLLLTEQPFFFGFFLAASSILSRQLVAMIRRSVVLLDKQISKMMIQSQSIA